MDVIQDTVFRIITKIVGPSITLEMDSSLSEMRVNSIKIIQIIATLESELNFELEEDDLIMSNFATPRQTINLIRDKYGAEALA